MRKVAEGLPRGGEKRIGGARETWGDSAKKGKQTAGPREKVAGAEKRGEERTKCGSTGEEKEARQVRGRILEWYRNARGTGYRQRIDDVIPRRGELLRGASVTLDRFDSRDRDPSPGSRLPTGASANPAVQRVLSSASCVARASRDRDDLGDRKRSARTTGLSSPVSSEVRLRKKEGCASIARAIICGCAVRAPNSTKTLGEGKRESAVLDQCAFRQCGWMYDDDDDDVRSLVIGVAMIVPRWSRHVERS